MSPEIGPEIDHIFPLLLRDGKSVFYESFRKMIFVNGNPVQSLSERHDLIFGYLVRNPNLLLPRSFFFHMMHPSDNLKETPRFVISQTLNPVIYELKKRLGLVDPILPKTIKTYLNRGLIYIPDESTGMWRRN